VSTDLPDIQVLDWNIVCKVEVEVLDFLGLENYCSVTVLMSVWMHIQILHYQDSLHIRFLSTSQPSLESGFCGGSDCYVNNTMHLGVGERVQILSVE